MESEVFPRSSDGVLPRDTRVWISSMLAETQARELNQPVAGEGISPTAASVASLFELNDASGNAVAFSVTPIVDKDGRDVFYMLTPDEPLAPGEYQVNGTSTTFSIGTEPTATPPAPPEVESQRTSSETGTNSS